MLRAPVLFLTPRSSKPGDPAMQPGTLCPDSPPNASGTGCPAQDPGISLRPFGPPLQSIPHTPNRPRAPCSMDARPWPWVAAPVSWRFVGFPPQDMWQPVLDRVGVGGGALMPESGQWGWGLSHSAWVRLLPVLCGHRSATRPL